MAHQMQAPDRLDSGRSAAPAVPRRDAGSGWTTFAGVMFLCAAAVNALYGISALVNDDYFAADELLFGDLAAWGVVCLVFAAVQTAVGVMILRHRPFGAFLGIILAALNGTMSLLWFGAYPLWTAVVLLIDGLIIYSLTVHAADWEQ